MADGFPSRALYDVLRLFMPFLAGSLTTLLGVFVRNQMEMRRQKRDEIYRPLFNEVSSLVEGDFPYDVEKGEYHSAWEDFDNFQKWSLNDSEQVAIESYTEKLDLLNQYTAVLESVMVDKVDTSELLVNEGLHHDKPNVGVLMSGLSGDRPRSVMQVGDWMDWFAHPMIVCEDADDLEQIMIEWSIEQGGGHHLAYREWGEDEFKSLFEFLQEADDRIDLPDDFANRQELLSQTQEEADSLAHRLKKKMDGWF